MVDVWLPCWCAGREWTVMSVARGQMGTIGSLSVKGCLWLLSGTCRCCGTCGEKPDSTGMCHSPMAGVVFSVQCWCLRHFCFCAVVSGCHVDLPLCTLCPSISFLFSKLCGSTCPLSQDSPCPKLQVLNVHVLNASRGTHTPSTSMKQAPSGRHTAAMTPAYPCVA